MGLISGLVFTCCVELYRKPNEVCGSMGLIGIGNQFIVLSGLEKTVIVLLTKDKLELDINIYYLDYKICNDF
jgi:hypothetical protein